MAATTHFNHEHDTARPRRTGTPQRLQLQARVDRVRRWALGAGIGATALFSLLAAAHTGAASAGTTGIASTSTGGPSATTSATLGSRSPASQQTTGQWSFSSGSAGTSLGSTTTAFGSGARVRSSSS